MQLLTQRFPHYPLVDLPAYQTVHSSGLDLVAAIQVSIVLSPLERQLIPTGIAVAIPVGYEGQVRPRSGLAIKQGLSMVNTPGTIDADYRGEIKVILINLGQEPVSIDPGQRIAQLVICPVLQPKVVEVAELPQTQRGSGGFGSTGV